MNEVIGRIMGLLMCRDRQKKGAVTHGVEVSSFFRNNTAALRLLSQTYMNPFFGKRRMFGGKLNQ